DNEFGREVEHVCRGIFSPRAILLDEPGKGRTGPWVRQFSQTGLNRREKMPARILQRRGRGNHNFSPDCWMAPSVLTGTGLAARGEALFIYVEHHIFRASHALDSRRAPRPAAPIWAVCRPRFAKVLGCP